MSYISTFNHFVELEIDMPILSRFFFHWKNLTFLVHFYIEHLQIFIKQYKIFQPSHILSESTDCISRSSGSGVFMLNSCSLNFLVQGRKEIFDMVVSTVGIWSVVYWVAFDPHCEMHQWIQRITLKHETGSCYKIWLVGPVLDEEKVVYY